ncbi:MAG: hypothetical protein EXR98_19055 [Gemmataceae bacterium]|nr:hypothetical protein [Gemmataceae bacterium]
MNRIAPLLLLLLPTLAAANPPVASYIFPAGAQRGTKVNVRVGGLFLYNKCGFEMLGKGITAPSHLLTTKTTWFEGPILPLPDSQRQEDYPKDMAGSLAIAADAPVGLRYWRVWTSQGATASMKFIVGDLPEIVEDEIDGDPFAVKVTLPVTINGRIFPREDIDIYSFIARKGQAIRCEVHAARLGSPLDARLVLRDAQGRRLAEADAPTGGDAALRFTAPADGEYQVRIQDSLSDGSQAHVYRLTVTTEPFVERAFPLGGRRGSTVDLELVGQDVPGMQKITIPIDAPADFPSLFSVRGKQTNPVTLDADDHPEFIAPKDFAKSIPLPAVLNGRIASAGQIDEWKVRGKKDDTWEFELRAARLGSRLDGVLTICDREGKTLAKAEANPADPSLRFAVPADGEYRVQIQDRFRSRGGPEFTYRLRIAPPAPADFRLTFTGDAITMSRKGTAKLKINADRLGGFKEPITLEIQGLPAQVSVTPTVIAANQTAVDLTFKAEDQAKIDVARLTIVGKAKDVQRTAKLQVGRGLPEQSSVLLAVALPTAFVIKGEYDMGFAARGGMHKHKYKVERKGYEGPIEISLADRQARHLQGVEGPTIVVPAGVLEFTYSAYLPPWMETGRTCRICVQGVGVIKEPDGSEHRVSFSSVNQNEQLVAVVGPGMLALETDRASFTATPGKQFVVQVQIRRGQGLEGPVELELIVPPHQRGLSAAKVSIGVKDGRGTLVITCADKLGGPFNMPILVRAILRQNGNPVVAEVKLDVQP